MVILVMTIKEMPSEKAGTAAMDSTISQIEIGDPTEHETELAGMVKKAMDKYLDLLQSKKEPVLKES